ncbi:MAG TPA: recombinase family protein [Burkholderiales bacterium]|nr:recombinase family protein [Burkholderiales bacterium]
MRAGILTRFSTDKQRDTSCDDQIRVCRARADRDNWSIVATYRDEGISGSIPVSQRRDGARMLADAFTGRFDILLMEGLDRLARDMVEQERIVRRLEHHGIRIIGVSDGYDSASSSRKLHRGMRGIINEVYLDDLRAKTHRGLSGQFDRGLFAGGMSYGYKSTVVEGGHRLEIEPTEAEWVRWIFEQYTSGLSPRAIAYELNNKSVPSPRGGTWAVSALYGSPAKGTGILNNELYIGRYIWNRSQWVKDPDTGKRKRIERPANEWRVVEREDLRIVSDEAWSAARVRISSPGLRGGTTKRPSTLLGGILRCPHCGGAVVAINAHQYGCAARRDRGPAVCRGVSVNRNRTDLRILSTIRDELLSPAGLSVIQQEVKKIMENQPRGADTEDVRGRISALDREIRNLTDAVAVAGWSEALRDRLGHAESERRRLRTALTARTRPDQIPDVSLRLKRLTVDLLGTLKRDPERAREALRDDIGEIPLIQEGTEIYAKVGIRTDRVLLAAGTDVFICGSGGRI